MRKRKQNNFWSDLATIALSAVGGYAAYKILVDNTPLVGQEVIPDFDPITGTESETAKKRRIQKTLETAKSFGTNTYQWKEGSWLRLTLST